MELVVGRIMAHQRSSPNPHAEPMHVPNYETKGLKVAMGLRLPISGPSNGEIDDPGLHGRTSVIAGS